MYMLELTDQELARWKWAVDEELKRRSVLNAPTVAGAHQVSQLGVPDIQPGDDPRRDHEKIQTARQEYVTYGTGAKRSERMPRYDLIVQSLVRRIAERCTGRDTPNGPDGGALKYGEGNWEKGLPTSDVLNHISHHWSQILDEWNRTLADYARAEGPWAERMECMRRAMNIFLEKDDHIGAIGWGLMVLCRQLEMTFHHDPAFEALEKQYKDRVTANIGIRERDGKKENYLR